MHRSKSSSTTKSAVSRAASAVSTSETITTGSVNAEHAVAGTLREGSLRQNSIPVSIESMSRSKDSGSLPVVPLPVPAPQHLPAATRPQHERVKSQSAAISRWSDSEAEQQPGTTWSRVPSMASSGYSSSSSATATPARQKQPADLMETIDEADTRSYAGDRDSLPSQDLSRASKGSLTSVMRRLDSIMGQIDLDSEDGGSPKPWRQQLSKNPSRSTRGTQPPPTPGGQSIRGQAL